MRPQFTEEKKVLPFDKVIELERVDDSTFRSIVKAYAPTSKDSGTYGGHVFAQAAWAAAQTVPEGFLVHSITGWFLLRGMDDKHFTYRVQKIRDGYKQCTRSVTVSQATAPGDMFVCTCSFKREESASIDVQEHVNLREVYQEVLKGKEDEPMLHAAAPGNDTAEFLEVYLPAHPEHFNPVGGVHVRKVEMENYNRSRSPLERKQLVFYTLRGALPLPTAPYPPPTDASKAITLTREANMHACAHLYVSDCNSLCIVPRHLDKPRDFTHMVSLSHTVIFHVGIRDLIMPPEPRIDHPDADPTLWEDGSLPLCNLQGPSKGDGDGRKWFVQEAWFTRTAGGRAMHTSRMWDYERGVHIATTYQDGMVRFKDGVKL